MAIKKYVFSAISVVMATFLIIIAKMKYDEDFYVFTRFVHWVVIIFIVLVLIAYAIKNISKD